MTQKVKMQQHTIVISGMGNDIPGYYFTYFQQRYIYMGKAIKFFGNFMTALDHYDGMIEKLKDI